MFSTDHVALSVTKLQETLELYKLFGFEVSNQFEAQDKSYRIYMLENGEGKNIELFHYTDFIPAPDYIDSTATDLPVIGTKHMAFRVNSIEDAVEFVETNGIAKDINIRTGRLGRRYFFVKDPNGILVEIIEAK